MGRLSFELAFGDNSGGGGSGTGWDGVVATYADLPDATTVSSKYYLVQTSSGIWPFKKSAGIWYSNGVAWSYLGNLTLGSLGDVSITSPTSGQVLKYNSTSGGWENGDGTVALHASTHRPDSTDPVSANAYHGVTGRSTVSPLPTFITTSTFTLACNTTPMTYYRRGIPVTKSTAQSCTLDGGTAGLYWVYFDATDTLVASTGFPSMDTTVIVASCWWNGTNYGLVQDERHNHTRNKSWHLWAHQTIGCRYGAGLAVTASGTGATATISVASGNIYDEDINFSISAQTNVRQIYQTSATALAFDSTIRTTPFIWDSGASGIKFVNGTTYELATLTANNRFLNYWVIATPDVNYPIYLLAETTTTTGGYISTALARAVPVPSLSAFGLSPEWKIIYRLVIRCDGVVQTQVASDDLRTVTSVAGGASPASSAASTTFAPTDNNTATNVQSAVQNCNPMTTAGDIIYGGTSGVATRLGVGTAGQVLKVNAGATAPEWGTASGGGITKQALGTLSSDTTVDFASGNYATATISAAQHWHLVALTTDVPKFCYAEVTANAAYLITFYDGTGTTAIKS